VTMSGTGETTKGTRSGCQEGGVDVQRIDALEERVTALEGMVGAILTALTAASGALDVTRWSALPDQSPVDADESPLLIGP